MSEESEKSKSDSPAVRIAGEYVILNGGQMWDYDIPLRDLDTSLGAHRWIAHLSEKTWATPEMFDAIRRISAARREESRS